MRRIRPPGELKEETLDKGSYRYQNQSEGNQKHETFASSPIGPKGNQNYGAAKDKDHNSEDDYEGCQEIYHRGIRFSR